MQTYWSFPRGHFSQDISGWRYTGICQQKFTPKTFCTCVCLLTFFPSFSLQILCSANRTFMCPSLRGSPSVRGSFHYMRPCRIPPPTAPRELRFYPTPPWELRFYPASSTEVRFYPTSPGEVRLYLMSPREVGGPSVHEGSGVPPDFQLGFYPTAWQKWDSNWHPPRYVVATWYPLREVGSYLTSNEGSGVLLGSWIFFSDPSRWPWLQFFVCLWCSVGLQTNRILNVCPYKDLHHC